MFEIEFTDLEDNLVLVDFFENLFSYNNWYIVNSIKLFTKEEVLVWYKSHELFLNNKQSIAIMSPFTVCFENKDDAIQFKLET